MDTSGFYRVNLRGEKVAVEFAEIHTLRKDILLYFDDNREEPISIWLPEEQFTQAYWQYLSLDFTKPWAESVHYQKLVQEGCLAILHGIALVLLDEPISVIKKEWQQVSVAHIWAYVDHFQPTSAKLATAKSYLLTTYSFLQNLTPEEVDANGMLKTFDLVTPSYWFTKEIIQAYGHWRVTPKA